ncbi:MAG TPA: anhydro-N-acetylmuramic acid kinase [Thermohalobaculum sp.]|nr:anhydro-N-acetylmuramic acid kinase [Thermohalobaculum sp.]
MVEAAKARPIWALGLMSGTSMDGVDAALVLTDGEEIAAFGDTVFLAYDARYRAGMAAANRVAPATPTAALRDPGRWPEELTRLAASCVRLHLIAIRRLGGAPEVIGFHGQTVAHRPAEGFTLQLGDGAAVAAGAGVTTAWDFRSADMAAGGEGAPLAPFYHFALARRAGLAEPVVFLNLGGVANVTWIDPAADAPQAPGALIAFDTGPANALIDDFMAARTGQGYDAGGATAARGRVAGRVLDALPASPYIAKRPPKSLDRNDFIPVLEAVSDLSTEDGAATLTAFTADCVATALDHMPRPPARWLVCGGGRRNLTMMRMLAERLAAPVEPVEALGLDGDMLEAQAYAYLAVRVLRGLPTSAPGTTGCRAPVSGGRVSHPGRDATAPRPPAGFARSP